MSSTGSATRRSPRWRSRPRTLPKPGQPVEALIDYVTFADLCQRNAAPTKGHACFTIEGQPRPWSEQNDGPAIQTVAILAAFDQLDPATQQVATALIGRNLDFLLGCYQDQTTNLWEEHIGFSFFARSVQLRCFREVAANTLGIPVPAGIADAIAWLENALEAHWNGSYYATMIGGAAPGRSARSRRSPRATTRTSTSCRRASTGRCRAPTPSCSPPRPS